MLACHMAQKIFESGVFCFAYGAVGGPHCVVRDLVEVYLAFLGVELDPIGYIMGAEVVIYEGLSRSELELASQEL